MVSANRGGMPFVVVVVAAAAVVVVVDVLVDVGLVAITSTIHEIRIFC